MAVTFRQYLFRLKWRFGVFILMYGLEISALTAVSIFTGNMITALTQFKVNAFVTAAIVMVVATIFQLVMQTLTNIYQVSLQRRLNNDIRTEITKSIAAMPFEQYHARSDAVYTSWMTNDVNTINTQGLRNVGYLIQASWQVVLSIFVLLTYQASLFATTLVCAVLLITVLQYLIYGESPSRHGGSGVSCIECGRARTSWVYSIQYGHAILD